MTRSSAAFRHLIVALACLLPAVAAIPAAERSADPGRAPGPLQATRFVSVGASGSDSLSVATDHCVLRIRQRSPGASPACKLAAHRARLGPINPQSPGFASRAARRDYAYALGNYAIALYINGDTAASQATTVLALEYLPGDPTLASNLAVLNGQTLTAGAAARAVK